MPFVSINAGDNQVSPDEPIVSVRRSNVAFNKAFIQAAVDGQKRCDVLIDAEAKQVAFRFGDVGYAIMNDGPNSAGKAIACMKLFRSAGEWIKPGRYRTHYNASEKAWIISL